MQFEVNFEQMEADGAFLCWYEASTVGDYNLDVRYDGEHASLIAGESYLDACIGNLKREVWSIEQDTHDALQADARKRVSVMAHAATRLAGTVRWAAGELGLTDFQVAVPMKDATRASSWIHEMDVTISSLQLAWRKLGDKETHRLFAKRAYGIRRKLAWLPWNPQQVFEESGPVIRHIQRVYGPFPLTIWPMADPFGCTLSEEVEGVGTTTATAGDSVRLVLQVFFFGFRGMPTCCGLLAPTTVRARGVCVLENSAVNASAD